MNNERNNKSHFKNKEKLKDIPKWAHRYAQNRTIPAIISLIIFASLFAGIALPSYFGGFAFMKGNMILFGICVFILALSSISLFFFSVPKWGGKFIDRLSNRFYQNEGNVSISQPEIMKKKRWVGHVVGLIFGSCVIASVILGNYIPVEYMQPVSALYVVPFMLFLFFWQRPKNGPIVLLWPLLYAIHAILIVVGVPILFKESAWNIMLPVFGYGFLTQLIGHIYSRFALKKLKDVTTLQGDTPDGA